MPDAFERISALADTFVKDPHAFAKVGQVVKVKVVEIDEKRKCIALTMRLTKAAAKVCRVGSKTGSRNDPVAGISNPGLNSRNRNKK
ncbi:S1 RNA binding family protein [Nitrosospira sp. Nsp2]|uniref:S1 RNA-binding domain-containing protein n=1 Tax=Nitrosospira sp. Nsp2 TaxID=136548 RepID=UPI000D4FE266|nr:S1 RNA binding family protein [Nitrosospira sp. Nsp2]